MTVEDDDVARQIAHDRSVQPDTNHLTCRKCGGKDHVAGGVLIHDVLIAKDLDTGRISARSRPFMASSWRLGTM